MSVAGCGGGGMKIHIARSDPQEGLNSFATGKR